MNAGALILIVEDNERNLKLVRDLLQVCGYETLEARNAADAKAYEVEKGITDHGAKLDEATKTSLQDKIKATREATKSDDKRTIESATDELAKAWMQAAQTLYQQAPPPGGAGGAGPEPEAETPPGKKKPGDGAVDADFEVVN